AEIAIQLGPQFILSDGTLDRVALRAFVFADAEAKLRLEAILHPRIQQTLQRRSDASESAVVAVAIPLLGPQSRARAYGWLDRVLIVEAPPELQIARIRARDGSSQELASKMVAAQLDSAGRLPMADDVLINDGDLTSLQQWTQRLLVRYRHLAMQG
ncbi:MAG: dephospho-CoA kinase, partial [Gammaproteobacteria bacterium]